MKATFTFVCNTVLFLFGLATAIGLLTKLFEFNNWMLMQSQSIWAADSGVYLDVLFGALVVLTMLACLVMIAVIVIGGGVYINYWNLTDNFIVGAVLLVWNLLKAGWQYVGKLTHPRRESLINTIETHEERVATLTQEIAPYSKEAKILIKGLSLLCKKGTSFTEELRAAKRRDLAAITQTATGYAATLDNVAVALDLLVSKSNGASDVLRDEAWLTLLYTAKDQIALRDEAKSRERIMQEVASSQDSARLYEQEQSWRRSLALLSLQLHDSKAFEVDFELMSGEAASVNQKNLR